MELWDTDTVCFPITLEIELKYQDVPNNVRALP
jgi:hypothetical protein